MPSYYALRLSAQRLKLCYDLAPRSVRRYLAAEIEHVRERIAPAMRVLELGCGYGRVLKGLSGAGAALVGIDTSVESLDMARRFLDTGGKVRLVLMDAVRLGFAAGVFDVVFCVQNGISAFHVDQRTLLSEAVRVTKSRGRVLFSSYADAFWEERLRWFRIQSCHGLVGEIDETTTRDGVIATKDGFTAGTVTEGQFLELAQGLGGSTSVQVVADSSVFCEIVV